MPVWKKGGQVWRAPWSTGIFTTVPDKAGATGAAFTASGRLWIEGNHAYFFLHDLGTGATTTVEAGPQSRFAYYGRVSPDGRFMVPAQSGGVGWGWFFCRDLSAPADDLWIVESKRIAVGPPVFVGADLVVTFESGGVGTVCVARDPRTGRVRAERDDLTGPPQGTAASADGSLRAGRTVAVYSAAEFGEVVAHFRSPAKAAFTGHAFHPSGRHLLVSSADQTVKAYNTASWQVDKVYDGGVGKLFFRDG